MGEWKSTEGSSFPRVSTAQHSRVVGQMHGHCNARLSTGSKACPDMQHGAWLPLKGIKNGASELSLNYGWHFLCCREQDGMEESHGRAEVKDGADLFILDVHVYAKLCACHCSLLC